MSTALKLRAEAEARANARAIRTELAKKAARDYQVAQKATDDNTARLRALRLAREAEETARAKEAEQQKAAGRRKAAAKPPRRAGKSKEA
jgi:hypothetical protein